MIEAIRKERDQAIKGERIRAEKAINEVKQEMKEMSASIIAEQKHNHECNRNIVRNDSGSQEIEVGHQIKKEESKTDTMIKQK